MKKLITAILLVTIAFTANAQRGDVEITGFGGYTFKNSFNIYGGKATINEGGTWGASLGFGIQDDVDLELYFSQQLTTFDARSTVGNLDVREEGTVNYWMLGGVKNFQANNPNLYFFGLFRLGGVTFAANSGQAESVTRFAASFGGGLKYFVSDRVGIKVTGNMLFPIVDVGASLWFGGGGSGAGISTWSPILQFNFNGGIFFRIMK